MRVSLIAAALFWAASGEGQESPSAAAATIGEDCQACHEDIVKNFGGRRHARQNCTACHGAADKHLESGEAKDIVNPSKTPARLTDKTCLGCHRGQPSHNGRIQSGHARSQTSCTSCHKVHEGSEARLAPAAINQRCSSCHASAWAEFQKPHRHAVTQGAMSCVSCHNPHGQPLSRVTRVAFNEPGCLNCHGDKRGPFVYEHAPMRQEGCAACHEPHGSVNPRMLTRPEVRQVCLECHSGIGAARETLGGVPPAFHDLRSMRYRNCTACHVKVHGSHADRTLRR